MPISSSGQSSTASTAEAMRRRLSRFCRWSCEAATATPATIHTMVRKLMPGRARTMFELSPRRLARNRLASGLTEALLEVAVEPVEQDLETRHAVEGRAGTCQLVALAGEAHELDLAAEQAQDREQVLTLLDVAA